MKIGILGSGSIGGPLGRLWAKAGHDVMFSSRHPEKLDDLVRQAGPNSRAGTLDEAARFGDALMEAVPFASIPNLPAEKLAGKIVLSAANYYPNRDGQMDLGGLNHSEWIASKLPGARLVKAFNMMRAEEIERRANDASLDPLAIFLASDEGEARTVAEGLVRDAQFEPVFVGRLAESSVFEAPSAPLYDVRLSPDEALQRLASLAPQKSTT